MSSTYEDVLEIILHGSSREMERKLKQLGKIPSSDLFDGESLLLIAITRGKLDMAKLLVRYADANDKSLSIGLSMICSSSTWSPEHKPYIKYGWKDQVELIKLLLEKGADPNYQTPGDDISCFTYMVINAGGGEIFDLIDLAMDNHADPTKGNPSLLDILEKRSTTWQSQDNPYLNKVWPNVLDHILSQYNPVLEEAEGVEHYNIIIMLMDQGLPVFESVEVTADTQVGQITQSFHNKYKLEIVLGSGEKIIPKADEFIYDFLDIEFGNKNLPLLYLTSL